MCVTERNVVHPAATLGLYRGRSACDRRNVSASSLALHQGPPGQPSRIPANATGTKDRVVSLGTILLIVVILILIGVLPTWPHARSWGYGPSGIVGVVLVIVLVLFLMGRL